MATGAKTRVIWRILDGRPGHDNQSGGLLRALSASMDCNCHDLDAGLFKPLLLNYCLKRCPPGEPLDSPDLIIGAGHRTHLPLLIAGRARGGKTVVIMQPSLPLFLFDYCLIPQHDDPPDRKNIIPTEGALNSIQPSGNHRGDVGLILIGGASRHFYWHGEEVLDQIRALLAITNDVKWIITDSPRTPENTRSLLGEIKADNATYIPFNQTGPGWMETQLARAGQAWITQDSLSMIYESVTSGTATGLLTLPVKKQNKLTRSIAGLQEKYGVVLFDEWQAGKSLQKPAVVLNESERCARLLLHNL